MATLFVRYARITLVKPAIDSAAFEHPLLAALRQDLEVHRYNHTWVVGDLKEDSELGVVMGRFGYPDTEAHTATNYDHAARAFVETEVEVPQAKAPVFVLRYTDGLMAFEESNDIKPHGFVQHFVALLNRAGFGEFAGDLLADEITASYRKFVPELTKVTRVKFEVVPTNPSDRPIFSALDVGIKAANAKRSTQTFENKEEGLRIDPPPSDAEETNNPIVRGLEMVEAGYGGESGYQLDGVDHEEQDVHVEYQGDVGLTRPIRDRVEDVAKNASLRLTILIEKLRHRFG